MWFKLYKRAISSEEKYSFNFILRLIVLNAHVIFVKHTGLVSFIYWIDFWLTPNCIQKKTNGEMRKGMWVWTDYERNRTMAVNGVLWTLHTFCDTELSRQWQPHTNNVTGVKYDKCSATGLWVHGSTVPRVPGCSSDWVVDCCCRVVEWVCIY